MVPVGQFGAPNSRNASSAILKPAAGKAKMCQHRLAALLRQAAIAVERSGLCVAVGVRRHDHAGHDEAITLGHVSARTGEIDVRGSPGLDAGFPIDDALVAAGGTRFLREQLVPVAARPARRLEVGRGVFTAWCRLGQRPEIDEACRCRCPCPLGRAVERGLQTSRRKIARGRVAAATVGPDGKHRAAIARRRRRLRDILSYDVCVGSFIDHAQRPEVAGAVKFAELRLKQRFG